MDKHDETTDIKQLFSTRYTVSKRQLGIVLLIAGVLGFCGLLALDLIGGGREGGIGPAQMAGLAASLLIALIGATLIPLGDKPA